jgi:hypothetical protein
MAARRSPPDLPVDRSSYKPPASEDALSQNCRSARLHPFPRLIVVVLFVTLVRLLPEAVRPPVYAASANLVWKPYLQQITSTSVIILWTTGAGANSLVRYSTDQS